MEVVVGMMMVVVVVVKVVEAVVVSLQMRRVERVHDRARARMCEGVRVAVHSSAG